MNVTLDSDLEFVFIITLYVLFQRFSWIISNRTSIRYDGRNDSQNTTKLYKGKKYSRQNSDLLVWAYDPLMPGKVLQG